MAPFRGVDYLMIDSLFSQEELLVRQTARRFVEDRVIPLIRDCYRDARFPSEADCGDGGTGFSGRQPRRLRLRRHEQCRVRPDHAGAGARRFRPPELCLRPGRAGHVSHPDLRLRGTEAAAGFPSCNPARRSAASASPSPISAPTPAACGRPPASKTAPGS